MESVISESLGRSLAVELNRVTGDVTILDAEHGIQLPAVSVLALMGFLSQNKYVWMEKVLGALEEKSA